MIRIENGKFQSNFKGSNYQGEVVRLALSNYGFLIRTGFGDSVSFEQFAGQIEGNYDTSNQQNGEVVRVLRELHTLNA